MRIFYLFVAFSGPEWIDKNLKFSSRHDPQYKCPQSAELISPFPNLFSHTQHANFLPSSTSTFELVAIFLSSYHSGFGSSTLMSTSKTILPFLTNRFSGFINSFQGITNPPSGVSWLYVWLNL